MVGCFWRIAASISKHCAGVTPAAKARRAAPLDGRAVRQRVGERDPQFKGISAAFDQRIDNFQRLLRSRIAKGDKGDEGAFLGDFSVGQTASHSVPSDFPSRFQDVMYGENVFVAAAGEINHQQLLFSGFSRIIFSAWARA